ncbi:STAS/SEC14 domain-containing protein [Paenibacillus sp. JNUCC31]|uniref:STAS/SEC14 domain-containing protein n=1 Tax=Paenibacillus sp. JNUCC-31 TaxID=2777983 RepID=UPI0017844022|nr:STAS/SEC14 domain-containing protein [Paenibacillus sp. JNUCC-31]QOS80438.1 STAS/SEC14 domain-containing protein [Paenibacillus sp. JNUCC-31]
MDKTNNLSTVKEHDLVITHLTGNISVDDVNHWYDDFISVCQPLLDNGQKFKLLVNRLPYQAEHFTVQKTWREKFFNDSLLKQCNAIAFVIESGDVMSHLKETYTSEKVQFFNDYSEAHQWITNFTAS